MITPAYSPTATERVLPRLALDFTTGVLDPRVTVTRALDTATRVNSSGFVETVNANLPRFDYDPVTLASKGLLIEGQRTNLFARSAAFNDAPWTKGETTVTADSAVAPDGVSTADKIVAAATSTFHNVYQSVTETTEAHTFSVYAKAAEYSRLQFADAGAGAWSATFDLASGATISTGGAAVLSSSIQNAGNGWFRCSITYTGSGAFTAHSITGYPNAGATLNNFGASYTGDGASGVYVWGAQLEAGAFATSYIPTTTTSLTRNADVVSMTGTNFSDWFNASEGTFTFKGDCYSSPSVISTILGVFQDYSNFIRFVKPAASTSPRFQVTTGGVSQANMTSAATTDTQVFTAALAYKVDNFGFGQNGVSVAPDTSGTLPSTPTLLAIGSLEAASGFMNGHVQKLNFYSQRLTSAELAAFSK